MEMMYRLMTEQRMRDTREAAARDRLVASLAAQQRWGWLGRMAMARAGRIAERPELSRSDVMLAG